MFFFTEKWIGFDFYGFHERLLINWILSQAPEKILHFSGFFFQVKEVLPYLFQLKPNQIQFSAEIFWQVLEHVRDSRWNDVCRMFPEDRAGIPAVRDEHLVQMP